MVWKVYGRVIIWTLPLKQEQSWQVEEDEIEQNAEYS